MTDLENETTCHFQGQSGNVSVDFEEYKSLYKIWTLGGEQQCPDFIQVC